MKTIKFFASSLLLLSSAGFSRPVSSDSNSQSLRDSVSVIRLYNPNTGEHLLTTSVDEVHELNGPDKPWKYEGVAWFAPKSGSPIYRLYSGTDHYYTMYPYERDSLVAAGWKYEGIAFYSGGDYNVYVAYNPNATVGAHNYTTSEFEQNTTLAQGWKYGAVAWQAVGMYDKYYPDIDNFPQRTD